MQSWLPIRATAHVFSRRHPDFSNRTSHFNDVKYFLAVSGGLLLYCFGFVVATNRPEVPPTILRIEASPVSVIDPALCEQLQSASVTIKTEEGSGSGILFRCHDGAVVVWTAAHVVGEAKTVEVMSDMIHEGIKVGEITVSAKVLVKSEEHDLALLEPEYQDHLTQTVTFHLSGEPPKVGTPVVHVGSWYGQIGSQSVSVGVVSKVGRRLPSGVYDQFTAPATPGSSGGGVFLPNGHCIGMALRQVNINFTLILPIRQWQVWAEAEGYGWALDAEKVRP